MRPRLDGPFRIIAKVNGNAYKIDLPCDYGVSDTFNLVDLQRYFDPTDLLSSLRTHFFEEGEDVCLALSLAQQPDPIQIDQAQPNTTWFSLVQNNQSNT